MKQEELEKILKDHEVWLSESGGERADFSHADLRRADLRRADLRRAIFTDADLIGTRLAGADLRRASLADADLSGADLDRTSLVGADLYGTDLEGAYLHHADLSNAECSHANFIGADLFGADLRHADLENADLRRANLSGANLAGAHLAGADLRGVLYDEFTAFFALQCPEEGAFIGWKKCKNDVIVKLLIPADAKRSSATTRKCRASKAIVLEVVGAKEAVSTYDDKFVYQVGKEVVPDGFDDNRWNECSNGIHFFLSKAEAENY